MFLMKESCGRYWIACMVERLNEDTAIGCRPRRKVLFGALAWPRARIEASRKSAPGVGFLGLAIARNRQIVAARKECAHRCGPPTRPPR